MCSCCLLTCRIKCSRTRLEFKVAFQGYQMWLRKECSRTRLEFKAGFSLVAGKVVSECSRTRLEFKVRGMGQTR